MIRSLLQFRLTTSRGGGCARPNFGKCLRGRSSTASTRTASRRIPQYLCAISPGAGYSVRNTVARSTFRLLPPRLQQSVAYDSGFPGRSKMPAFRGGLEGARDHPLTLADIDHEGLQVVLPGRRLVERSTAPRPRPVTRYNGQRSRLWNSFWGCMLLTLAMRFDRPKKAEIPAMSQMYCCSPSSHHRTSKTQYVAFCSPKVLHRQAARSCSSAAVALHREDAPGQLRSNFGPTCVPA